MRADRDHVVPGVITRRPACAKSTITGQPPARPLDEPSAPGKPGTPDRRSGPVSRSSDRRRSGPRLASRRSATMRIQRSGHGRMMCVSTPNTAGALRAPAQCSVTMTTGTMCTHTTIAATVRDGHGNHVDGASSGQDGDQRSASQSPFPAAAGRKKQKDRSSRKRPRSALRPRARPAGARQPHQQI